MEHKASDRPFDEQPPHFLGQRFVEALAGEDISLKRQTVLERPTGTKHGTNAAALGKYLKLAANGLIGMTIRHLGWVMSVIWAMSLIVIGVTVQPFLEALVRIGLTDKLNRSTGYTPSFYEEFALQPYLDESLTVRIPLIDPALFETLKTAVNATNWLLFAILTLVGLNVFAHNGKLGVMHKHFDQLVGVWASKYGETLYSNLEKFEVGSGKLLNALMLLSVGILAVPLLYTLGLI